MRPHCGPVRFSHESGIAWKLLHLLLALCLILSPGVVLADNCELDVVGWPWDPNPVSISESTKRKVQASFKSLQMKECKVTSQSWEWEITRVDYNAEMTGGTWVVSAETLPKVDFIDTGTRTSTLQSPTMRFKTDALDKVGRWRLQYRVRASYASEDCGNCAGTGWQEKQTPEVVVANILIESIQFKSDHGLLRDYNTDYAAGGDLFPEPEWVRKVRNAPISHTKKKKVDVKVTIKGAATDNGTYKLKSTQFGEKAITLAGGIGSADMTSIDALQNKIEKATLSYDWQIIDAADKVVATATTTHTAYLTYGTPREPDAEKHKVTVARMERAIKYAGKGDPDDPFDIILKAMAALGNFMQDNDPVLNAWTVPDGKADCAEQSRFIKKVIYMVGIDGDVKTILVYAIPAAPKTPIEEEHGTPECKYGLNQDAHYHPTKTKWRAWLDAGNPNAFESTVRFTSGGKTKYFPGGVPNVSHDNAKDVLLKTFKGLGWYDTEVPNTFLDRGKFMEYVEGGKYP